MAYFPFYVELKDVSVLIVGGGKVALHKVKRILDYGPKIKVVAKKVDERIKNIKGVEWEEREFEGSDVEGVRFVIAAAGDEELDEHITSLCNDKGIFINVVDVKDKCDFIFPSVVSRGKLEIGISSSGASPRITTLLAGEIDSILPDNIEEILDYLEKLRPYAKQKISNDVLRARFLSYMAELTYSRRNIPDDEELIIKLNSHREQFITAMDDDLNTADGVAAVFELVKDINTSILDKEVSKNVCQTAAAVFDELCDVLGIQTLKHLLKNASRQEQIRTGQQQTEFAMNSKQKVLS